MCRIGMCEALARELLVMNRIKIQHYVPRFYLRNFSIDESNTERVYCYDKSNMKKFPTNISKIAYENFFNDSDGDIDQLLEKGLGKLESEYNIAYKSLINSKDIDKLSNKQRRTMSHFIASQLIRTKENREHIRDMIKQLHNRLSWENLSKKLKQQLQEVNKESSIKSIHLSNLKSNIPKYSDIIYNMKWLLFTNITNIPYLTSDNPITRHNLFRHDPYGNMGLLCQGIELHFPLNPKLCLLTCDPATYAWLPSIFKINDEQNIIHQNSLQVLQSTRHLFSNVDDFYLADRMIKDSPEVGDIHRKRITMH